MALQILDTLLASPSVRLLTPGDRFARIFNEPASRANATGNLAFDRARPASPIGRRIAQEPHAAANALSIRARFVRTRPRRQFV